MASLKHCTLEHEEEAERFSIQAHIASAKYDVTHLPELDDTPAHGKAKHDAMAKNEKYTKFIVKESYHPTEKSLKMLEKVEKLAEEKKKNEKWENQVWNKSDSDICGTTSGFL